MLTKRSDNFSKWYNELVSGAQLAENSSVRGCMVIKPYGFSIWESMKSELDKKFKATGHQNAYFHSLFLKVSSRLKKKMQKVLLKNVLLLPTTG